LTNSNRIPYDFSETELTLTEQSDLSRQTTNVRTTGISIAETLKNHVNMLTNIGFSAQKIEGEIFATETDPNVICVCLKPRSKVMQWIPSK